MPGQRRRRGPEGVAAALHRRRIRGAREPTVEISGLLGSVEGVEGRKSRDSRVAVDGPTPRRFSVLVGVGIAEALLGAKMADGIQVFFFQLMNKVLVSTVNRKKCPKQ